MRHLETFICRQCGKEFDSRRKDARYCSRTCYQGRIESLRRPCLHNDGVDCEQRKCSTCGWNPKVARKRLEALL